VQANQHYGLYDLARVNACLLLLIPTVIAFYRQKYLLSRVVVTVTQAHLGNLKNLRGT
jgi:hypothetical protein